MALINEEVIPSRILVPPREIAKKYLHHPLPLDRCRRLIDLAVHVSQPCACLISIAMRGESVMRPLITCFS